MQAGETWRAVKKCHDRGTLVEALLVRPPRLQRAAGHLKHLGRLALRKALGFEITIPLKPLRAFDANPALGAILVASLLILDDCAHRDLL
jgi:hypothetical protein